MPRTLTRERFFYRCADCLSSAVLNERLWDADCVCGGYLRLLGPITDEGRWMKEEERPKCDARCTDAIGTKCRCQCGGENHARKWEAWVVLRHPGGKAVVQPLNPEEAKRRAEEVREAIDAVHDALARRYGKAWEDYLTRRWIPDKTLWWTLKQWNEELAHARGLQTHKGRMKALRRLVERIEER